MSNVDEVRESLNKIKERLETEASENLRKEFWKIVGRIKRMLTPPEDLVDTASIIRNTLFEERFRVIISTRSGALLFALSSVISWLVFAYFLGTNSFTGVVGMVELGILNFFILYLGYPFGRLLGGKLAGIRFEGFYRYSPGELGLKIEYKSYLMAGSKRQLMFASACLWVFLLESILIFIVYLFARNLTIIPTAFLGFLAVSYVLAYKKKTGELYRFARERKINADMRRASPK